MKTKMDREWFETKAERVIGLPVELKKERPTIGCGDYWVWVKTSTGIEICIGMVCGDEYGEYKPGRKKLTSALNQVFESKIVPICRGCANFMGPCDGGFSCPGSY